MSPADPKWHGCLPRVPFRMSRWDSRTCSAPATGEVSLLVKKKSRADSTNPKCVGEDCWRSWWSPLMSTSFLNTFFKNAMFGASASYTSASCSVLALTTNCLVVCLLTTLLKQNSKQGKCRNRTRNEQQAAVSQQGQVKWPRFQATPTINPGASRCSEVPSVSLVQLIKERVQFRCFVSPQQQLLQGLMAPVVQSTSQLNPKDVIF